MKSILKKRVTPEHLIQTSIANYLILKKYLVIRMNSGAIKTDNRFIRYYQIMNTKKSAGVPDLIAFKNDNVLMVEVKNEIGKLSPSQKDFIEVAERHGNTVLVATSWQQVDKYLKDRIK